MFVFYLFALSSFSSFSLQLSPMNNQNTPYSSFHHSKQNISPFSTQNIMPSPPNILIKSISSSLFSKTSYHNVPKQKRKPLFQTNAVLNENLSHFSNKQTERVFVDPKLEDFEIGDLLGRGTSCSAYLSRHKETGFYCCIKTMNRKKVEKNLAKFIKSMKIQIYVNNPNVIKTYGIIVQEEKVYIITELCLDGDLAANLKEIKKAKQQKQILKGIIRGLRYLHNHQIQHRDLKLENVLLCWGMSKISDLEIAVNRNYDMSKRRISICGSPMYFSPEMLQTENYEKQADIWCLGIIAYEILCGCFPFEIRKMQDLKKITEEEIKYPQNMGKEAKDLVQRILVKNPSERLNLLEIMKHSFLTQEAKGKKGQNA